MAVDTIFYDLVTPEPYSIGSEMKHSSVSLGLMKVPGASFLKREQAKRRGRAFLGNGTRES